MIKKEGNAIAGLINAIIISIPIWLGILYLIFR